MKELLNKIVKKVLSREFILYSVFGVLTSVQNVVMFALFLQWGMDYMVGNLITLIIVKLTAYVLNKNFVFRSKTGSFKGLCKEFFRFLVARGATMLIDYFGLIFMVETLSMDKVVSKIIVTIVVVVLNYVIGKKHVFKDAQS